jgi:hypothetical protein
MEDLRSLAELTGNAVQAAPSASFPPALSCWNPHDRRNQPEHPTTSAIAYNLLDNAVALLLNHGCD